MYSMVSKFSIFLTTSDGLVKILNTRSFLWKVLHFSVQYETLLMNVLYIFLEVLFIII